VGTEGTISNYDYAETIRIQTRDCLEGKEIPVDALGAPYQNPVQYILHCMGTGVAIEGPLSPTICRIGQQIVDTAYQSAQEKRTLPLIQ
jgi:glucose-fructose oxidoreductase